jgi:hypothetical protein
LEIRARVLLELGQARKALPLIDAGLATANEMGYLPTMWRLYAAKARATEMLGDDEGAAQAYVSAAQIVHKLAETIPDAAHKGGFLSDTLTSSILNAAGSKELGP